MSYTLPESFIQTIRGVHSERAELWLQGFDRLLAYCEDKWSCQIQLPSPYPLSYNFVAPVRMNNGQEAVLKLAVPSKDALYEIAALQLYQGLGAARLLDAEPERGILLIEKLHPGKTLKSVPDEEQATLLAIEVMRSIRRPAPDPAAFPSVAQWFQGYDKLRRHFQGGTGPLPEPVVQKAETLYRQLQQSAAPLEFLHGDLHHENILSSTREPWLAIDPKGVLGEAEYGVVPFLMNHHPEHDPAPVLDRRVRLFAQKLGLDRRRMLAWAYCHAVLSAWWCVEDQVGGVENNLRTAELFDALLEA